MKILMLTPYLPYPPSSGGQIRSYNLIKHLSKKHQVTLCSLIKYEEEKKYVDHLKKFCQDVYVFKRAEKPWTLKNIINTGFSTFPFLVVRNYSPEEKEAISTLLQSQQFDLTHAETFYVSPHIPSNDIPTVLVDQTIEYQVYQHFVNNFKLAFLRPLLYLDVLKIRYWEAYYWKKAAQVVAVSERDANVMKGLVNGLSVAVIPNGVGEDLDAKVGLHYNKTILFMGNYAWLQNIEAANILAQEVFPLIKEKVPDSELLIAGQNIERIAHLRNQDIQLLDLRIEDIAGVKKAYQHSGVLVAPLYGPGGTRLKILGAMAAHLPVVTTDVGIEGIDAINGESVLYGKSSQELATLTISVLQDQKLYKKIAENARKLVDEHYTYAAISKRLDAVYTRVVNKERKS